LTQEENLKKLVYRYLLLAFIALTLVGLDQWTKAIVRANLALGESWMPLEWLAPHARIVHWYNTGVAFGMFQGMNVLFSVLAILVSIAIIYYYRQVPDDDWTLRVAMGFQLAGALGNLVDRITVGHVTDFISVGAFPVFNVADASITIGVAILLLGVWIQERRKKQEAVKQADEEAARSNATPPLDETS
jgi:signal peptidase II